MNILYMLCGFCLVAFGHPLFVPWMGVLASAGGIALFWHALKGIESIRKQFWLSVGWFGAVEAVQIFWIREQTYMGPLIWVIYALLIFGMGLQFGVLTWICRPKEVMTVARALGAAGFWVWMEWIRLFFCTGFPWNPVGFALTGVPLSLEMAALVGVYGMSFWVIWVNALVLAPKKKWLWGLSALFPYLVGLGLSSGTGDKTVSVALVQTGLLPEQKYKDPKALSAFVPPLIQWGRVLPLLGEKPLDLIVFPEAAFPFGVRRQVYQKRAVETLWMNCFQEAADFPERLLSNGDIAQKLADRFGAEVIIGLDDEEGGVGYNGAFHFMPNRSGFQRYEKQILMPVAEYIPFSGLAWFRDFVRKEFGIAGVFSPGDETKIFQGQALIGIAICSEETYSGLIRKVRNKGAELIVTISNDAWFPKTQLPEHHLAHGKLRAVESGVPFLRACNTGITAALDLKGNVLAAIPKAEGPADVLFASVPLKTRKTPYSLWGDAAPLCLGALFFIGSMRKKLL